MKDVLRKIATYWKVDGRKDCLYEILLANIGCILLECEPLVDVCITYW